MGSDPNEDVVSQEACKGQGVRFARKPLRACVVSVNRRGSEQGKS